MSPAAGSSCNGPFVARNIALPTMRIADEFHKVRDLEKEMDSVLGRLADAVESCLETTSR